MEETGRKFKVNFKSYREKQERETPEPGIYPGKIVSLKPHTSKKGDDMLVFEAVLTDKIYTGNTYKLYVFTDREDMMWKTEQTLQAIGLTDENDSPLEEWDEDEVVGRPIGLKLIEGEYQGVKRAELDRFVAHYDGDEIISDLPF